MHTLTTSAIPLENSRGGKVSRNAASMKMYSGCQNAPMRFFPWGVSMAVFPPTLESTMASRVVGIWTKRTPRMLGTGQISNFGKDLAHAQGRSNESNQIANDSPA